MEITLSSGIVDVDWLNKHLNHKEIVILDATIPKINQSTATSHYDKKVIKNAIRFDLKNDFSDVNSDFPNTVLPPKLFQSQVRKLGINNSSCIIVYDNLGIYSSPRVWWMFNLMGFKNIGVLNGGLQEWINLGFKTSNNHKIPTKTGDFTVKYNSKMISFTKDVLQSIENNSVLTVDARSKDRFSAKVPEPRKGLKGGHIPNSLNLPFSSVLKDNKFKSIEELRSIFSELFENKESLIFSCGSGITASILALVASELGYNNSVYDGSWTEWASTNNLPITN